MIIFSARFKGEELLKVKGYVNVTLRLILTSNCQTLVAVAMMQTLFFEMFLNVAQYNGSSFRKCSLCKLSTANPNEHAILHNTSISNMKFIPHTHSCIHQSGYRSQKGLVTFSKRTDIYKRKQTQKGKISRKVGIVR